MKGTEKQIKWAEDIKARFEARVIKVYASGEMAENRPVIDKALEFISNKYVDAKYWIDNEQNRRYEGDLYLEWFAELTNDPDMQKIF